MTIADTTALPLDLLYLVRKEGPLPLRFNLDVEAWEFLVDGEWVSDRYAGRKFTYLQDLWFLTPPTIEWNRIRRQLSRGFRQAKYEILREWRPYLTYSSSGLAPVPLEQLPPSGTVLRARTPPPGCEPPATPHPAEQPGPVQLESAP